MLTEEYRWTMEDLAAIPLKIPEAQRKARREEIRTKVEAKMAEMDAAFQKQIDEISNDFVKKLAELED